MKAVYVIASDGGLVKIGRSRNAEKRRKMLQTANGHSLRLCHTTENRADFAAIEKTAHRILYAKRRAGEWFDVEVAEAIQAVTYAIELVELAVEVKKCKGCKPQSVILRRPKRKPGCKPKHDKAMGNAFTLRLPAPMMREIEAIVAKRQDGSTKADVLRKLVAEGVEIMERDLIARRLELEAT